MCDFGYMFSRVDVLMTYFPLYVRMDMCMKDNTDTTTDTSNEAGKSINTVSSFCCPTQNTHYYGIGSDVGKSSELK